MSGSRVRFLRVSRKGISHNEGKIAHSMGHAADQPSSRARLPTYPSEDPKGPQQRSTHTTLAQSTQCPHLQKFTQHIPHTLLHHNKHCSVPRRCNWSHRCKQRTHQHRVIDAVHDEQNVRRVHAGVNLEWTSDQVDCQVEEEATLDELTRTWFRKPGPYLKMRKTSLYICSLHWTSGAPEGTVSSKGVVKVMDIPQAGNNMYK
ncbi:hypothetical protein BC826DRAFT_972972 [Russula brevipes]|nr:hypothetical protein BC826DRAFT_972972 [Russula brevipes]